MIYYFGFAADPITKAHIGIIKSVIKHLSANDKFYVAVTDNDEKNFNTSFEDRQHVVQQTLESVFGKNSPEVIRQNTRTYPFLKEIFLGKDNEVVVILGEDEWNDLLDGKWNASNFMLKTYSFMVARRNNVGKLRDIDKYNVKIMKIDESDGISATEVRRIFYRNPMTLYTDVKQHIMKKTFEIIKDNKLYRQNGNSYDAEQAAFIEKYKIDKKKNGWAEPSVTVDIVAYNGNKILLIRRGNFPYKWFHCLPGGFFDLTDSDLNHTAAREFEEETTIKIDPEKFQQIKTYSHIFDPRLRIIDVAFAVRVNAKDMKKALGSDDAIEANWFDLDDLPPLGFHHSQIIDDWKEKFRI